MPLLPVTYQKIMNRLVIKTFYFHFIFLFIFLTEEKTVNPELKCPSINQLKREKTKY